MVAILFLSLLDDNYYCQFLMAIFEDIALCGKNRNQGDQKFLKKKTLVCLHFQSEIIQTFLNDAKLPKCMIDFGFDRVRQIFAKLVAKNMRGSSVKSEILCVHQLG